VLFTRISGSLAVYSSSIGEFLSPFASSANHPAVTLFPYYLGLLALALGLSRRPRLSEAIIVAAFVFLSVKARRNLALLGIATAPILSRWLWQATQTEPLSGLWRRVPRGAGRRVRNVGAVACLGLLGAYTYALVSGRTYTTIESNRFFGAGVAELAFPQAAAERIRAMGAPGPVFSDLSAGSYLIWADPERPVFIDGRLEVHDTEHFARYLAMLSGGEAWTQADREFGFQTVILDHGAARTLTGKLLVDGTWALCHVDAQAIVLVRRTEENAGFLAAHAIRPEEVETIAPPIGPPAAELVPPPPGFWQRTFGWRRYPWSELGMGQILFQAGRYDRAAEQYRRAVHRSPILASPRILLAGALNQLRRPDEAFSVLEGAEVLARTAADKGRLQATRGDVLLAVGRFDDAVAAYDSWLPESSAGAGSAVGRINRAMALHGVGRSEEAAAAVRRALVDLPTYVEGYRILGEIEEARGQTAAAVSSYEIYRNSGGTNEAALQALQRLDPSQ
jgi:hypothetical protein